MVYDTLHISEESFVLETGGYVNIGTPLSDAYGEILLEATVEGSYSVGFQPVFEWPLAFGEHARDQEYRVQLEDYSNESSIKVGEFSVGITMPEPAEPASKPKQLHFLTFPKVNRASFGEKR
jgi:hypothetical protein